jgi:hypothetical protein
MMKYFSLAWLETSLSPLEKLLWLFLCDTGIDQLFKGFLSELAAFSGASAEEVLAALRNLDADGHISLITLSNHDGFVTIETKYAAIERAHQASLKRRRK